MDSLWRGSPLISHIRTSTIGSRECVPSPLGPRLLTYADSTATGRPSTLIESPISALVLPVVGNAHSSSSFTGASAQNFLDESRAIVRDAVAGASDARHAVIFGGAGSTWASNRLVALLAPPRARSDARCSFAGCHRLFATHAELLAHARRTHADGEAAAWAARADALAITGDGDSNADGTDGVDSTGEEDIAVVVGPFAHHSSFLPWRAAGARLEVVRSVGSLEGRGGDDDAVSLPAAQFRLLDAALRTAAARNPRLLVAIFTLGSNVSGATLDFELANALAHAHGAVTVWDCAAAAPHRPLVTEPGTSFSAEALAHALRDDAWVPSVANAGRPRGGAGSSAAGMFPCNADALFFSPHKFEGGGAGAPGALVVRRSALGCARGPSEPGGGTVSFVTPAGEPTYSGDDVAREEAGSPPVVGATRAGLCLRLVRAVGWERIRAREEALAAVARAAWAAHPNVRVLGERLGGSARRLPIVSIAVVAPGVHGLLHWNFVSAVLNDVFGVQARGGCLCAGPYAHELLGLNERDTRALAALLAVEADELLRPGVVRVSFTYSMSHASFRAIINAVLWVADHGAELLHLYSPDARTGEWRAHRAALRAAFAAGGRVGEGDAIAQRAAAAEIISAATRDDARGAVLLDAARGGSTRDAPRRWLSAVDFGDDGVVTPSLSLRAEFKDEAGLQRAYALEAERLRLGAQSSPPAPAPADVTGLLSEDGIPLRWFALAGAPPAPWHLGDTLRCIPQLEIDGDLLHVDARALDILSSDTVGAETEAEWDGVANVGLMTTTVDSPSLSPSTMRPTVVPAVETSTVPSRRLPRVDAQQRVTPAASAVAVSTLPSSGLISECPIPSLASNSGRGGGTVAAAADDADDSDADEVDWRVARNAATSFAEASRAESATPPRLTPLEFATRGVRLAATQAALRAVVGTGPSPALARTLAHGLKEAISQYRMIRHGDKILVGLSGGKDSMTLLLQLLRLQAIAPVFFEVGAVTVDPQYPGFDPSPLQNWCASLGVPFSFEKLDVVALAKEKMGADSLCAFCSRLKRGLLYSACRRRGYNVLALGQHLDDLAESFVMSAFKNGMLRTMKAHYLNDARDVRIIRPLCLLRERSTREFASACTLPVIAENCPACFSGPTARYLTKRLLAREEATNSGLFSAILNAIRPLMTSEGSTKVLAAAASTLGDDVRGAKPHGFVAATLVEPAGAAATLPGLG